MNHLQPFKLWLTQAFVDRLREYQVDGGYFNPEEFDRWVEECVEIVKES